MIEIQDRGSAPLPTPGRPKSDEVAPQAQPLGDLTAHRALNLVTPPTEFTDDGEHAVVRCPAWCTRGDEHAGLGDVHHWSTELWPTPGSMIHLYADGGSPQVRLMLGDHVELVFDLEDAAAVRDALTKVLAAFAAGDGRTKRTILPTAEEALAQCRFGQAAGPFEPEVLAWTSELWTEWGKRFDAGTPDERLELVRVREAHLNYVDAFILGPTWPDRFEAVGGDELETVRHREGEAGVIRWRERLTQQVLAADPAYAEEVAQRRAYVRALAHGQAKGTAA